VTNAKTQAPTEAKVLMSTERRMVGVVVSPDLLRERMGMPANVDIIGADWDHATQAVRLYVEGPAFAPLADGVPVPFCRPSLRWDWGLG
jgi:hypothetical protein